MPAAVAICSKCSAYRHRSNRDIPRGEALRPEYFDPIPPQPRAEDGAPSTCYACQTPLTFRALPDGVDPVAAMGPLNGQGEMRRGQVAGGGVATATVAVPGVTELFRAEPGETVREVRDIGRDKLLFITSQRVVRIDISAMTEGEEP